MKLNKNKIEAMIVNKGLGIMEFCKMANIKYTTLAYSLNANNVRIKTVNKIAKALEVNPDEILKKE